MTFTPSDAQVKAIANIKDWFKNRTKTQQIFRVFGYAGAGKTTIVKHAIAELGLQNHVPGASDDKDAEAGGVLYAAYTGKAALVMTRKGTPACTIHSLIYCVSEPTKEEMDRVKQQIADLVVESRNASTEESTSIDAQIAALRLRLKNMHKPAFVLNNESEARNAALIVLDEVSMVPKDMAMDLMSFRRPVLVLGDPGQLPPIKGDGYFTQAEPDVMLTEIHRQAGESAIIRLATMARCGTFIPYGKHDEFVWKMKQSQIGPAQMLRGGQVICGKNATRYMLNNAMKAAAGFPGCYPSGKGEKIICLKNRNDLGIVNGMFMELIDPEDAGDNTFAAVIKTEDGVVVGGLDKNGKALKQIIYKGHFEDHIHVDPDRDYRDHFIKKLAIECAWGYAITCHKSQGSQWNNVIVWDDGLGGTSEDRNRWLYTAITRAEQGLVLLA